MRLEDGKVAVVGYRWGGAGREGGQEKTRGGGGGRG
jgi:hypothetical protein